MSRESKLSQFLGQTNSQDVITSWLNQVHSDPNIAKLKVILQFKSFFQYDHATYYYLEAPVIGQSRLTKFNQDLVTVLSSVEASTSYYPDHDPIKMYMRQVKVPLIVPIITNKNYEAILDEANDVEWGLDRCLGRAGDPFLVCDKFECDEVSVTYFKKHLRMPYCTTKDFITQDVTVPPHVKLIPRFDHQTYPDRSEFT